MGKKRYMLKTNSCQLLRTLYTHSIGDTLQLKELEATLQSEWFSAIANIANIIANIGRREKRKVQSGTPGLESALTRGSARVPIELLAVAVSAGGGL